MTSTDTLDPAVPFSVQLRTATGQDHRRAEKATAMDELLAGRLPRSGYAAMLVQLWFVYDTLEELTDELREDPVVGPFAFEELRRVPSLERDLGLLLGPDWRSGAEAAPSTQRYCDRMRAAAAEWSGGLVAHHYTRYLGDLSGGLYIGKQVERTYGIDAASGSAFFHFEGIEDPTAFKDEYRRRLDAAPWDPDQREQVIAEVSRAYALNTALLEDLPIDG